MSLAQTWEKWEKRIGGLKFAVIIISLFSLCMIVGTFLESYHGADYASRVMYKTLPFMAIQFCMFLSILFAAFRRLPPKKRLYGFYTIHTGLITVGAGSFMTYYAGIDGHISLSPNEPNRHVILNDDIVQITFQPHVEGQAPKRVSKKLPYTAFASSIDDAYDGVVLKRYLPYADQEFSWQKEAQSYPENLARHSSGYLIANDNVAQNFRLTLHPEANQDQFQSNLELGPLNILYFPAPMQACFGPSMAENPSQLFFWDAKGQTCFTPESKKLAINKTKQGKRFIAFRHEGAIVSFFPDFSPWPLNEDFTPQTQGALRVFSKQLFTSKPILFLFGKSLAYYDKNEQRWQSAQLELNKPQELPWMGFQLQLTEHYEDKLPHFTPTYIKPIQQKGALIKGQLRALEVDIAGSSYWVTSDTPLELSDQHKTISVELLKDHLALPFELVLKQFKMDKDPGTNNPASYESFVRIFSDQASEPEHHIFMNNPLKYNGLTFYQASYTPLEDGAYSSTLSVNMDPGRPFKYLGSLLLVFGAIWHYYLNRKKNPAGKTAQATSPSSGQGENLANKNEAWPQANPEPTGK